MGWAELSTDLVRTKSVDNDQGGRAASTSPDSLIAAM
jgi:hypothetical protein